MLNVLIIGASGYAGAELVNYMNRHTFANVKKIFVSKNSLDLGKLFSEVHQQFKNIIDLRFEAISNSNCIKKNIDAVFLATDHSVSHSLVPFFLSSGCIVFDLSAAYRIKKSKVYLSYYGFVHQYKELLKKSVYGLAEWKEKKIKKANLIAVPGCYATCIQLALKPLIEEDVLCNKNMPIINAVSGVSGAGRKANLNNSFCEVSLQPYNIFTHRHNPEIVEQLGIPVIFIPHLGSFSRGIIATITCKLKSNIKSIDIYNIFHKFYKNKPLIRMYKKFLPSIRSVEKQPFCDIGFIIKDNYIVIVTAEDNLLKGAAAQAVQCFNIRFGFSETESII
ncbi:N-acetyl-gamma-glutamyl-phosphate reductase [Buchnera aphidicola str. Ak (Acyrthosiphon kondoi)]|uniref:N-acetyl-gamma-glutamyl-phosphate reductase n=1 Tax=Buchnera aphidicola str. Ak (Acyrthosiphon kondoi) TaxID=1005090 RepID=G2LMC8_9GAMM|nr:N-acetyl-gamma-glutamyl-phosphate reductase [Buchnera aphidicola]AEO08416.1 N-acetyl-gamma-glutamyl-phosphate reductase [Buchnera aphidicola str. Ak (Acyrthosiphon kondoi)]WAI18227.1 MAG: N-acetyl-gamma-glutamyl-phosphate reductase [Buchnera aphidicola (Acyrthosiphon caraganae)]